MQRLQRAPVRGDTATVAASVAILDLLMQQLKEVSADVEASVVRVCHGFSDMNDRAMAAVKSSAHAIGDGSNEGDELNAGNADTLVHSVRDTVEDLLRNIRSTCDFSRELRTEIQSLDQRVQSVEASLSQVETISQKAKLVALNGQIEAARLGEAGVAFGVVAHETKSLASNAASSSVNIRQLVTELGVAMHEASDKLQERTDTDALMAEKSDETVRNMLHLLKTTHDRLSESARFSSIMAERLSHDIGRAVTAMQFQDRVNQRIEHVVETLGSIRGALQELAMHADPQRVAPIVDQWMVDISSRYTMDAERGAMTDGTSSSGQFDSNSVELF